MYDVLLKGEDPAKSCFGDQFWNEFFLLRPKVSVLEAEMAKVMTSVTASTTTSTGGGDGSGGGGNSAQASTQAAAIKNNLNLLFGECLDNLGEEHHIKVLKW